MKKMNKKGFTLVEMLVVIAIIAILVSILIPTVLGATKKAKAATDAANLRSALAEFEIWALTNSKLETSSTIEIDKDDLESGDYKGAVSSIPECKSVSDAAFSIVVKADGSVDAFFGDYNIASFQAVAEAGGTLATASK